MEGDLFRWLILKMRMKNNKKVVIIDVSVLLFHVLRTFYSYYLEGNLVQWITIAKVDSQICDKIPK